MAKKVFYDADARQRLLGGAEALYEAVKTTMGPKGRNVVLAKSFGSPTITHDGVTVAKGIELADNDPETYGYKAGAELIKQAASKMNDVAGDGTTTVTVLTYHILSEANKLIAAGHSPIMIRKGLEAAGATVVAELVKMSEKIGSDKKRVSQIATISAGDPDIGDLIADVMEKVGKDGIVTVEEGQGLQLESDVVEGFTFDRGFISPYMVTDPSRMEAVYDKPAIVVTDKKISSMQEMLPLVERLVQTGQKNLVIIAEDVEGEALGTLVLNKLKGVLNAVAIKAPNFGERRTESLVDIATLTGATLISSDQGQSFETAGLEVVGSARRVIVSKDETTIIEGDGNKNQLTERLEQIKSQAKIATSDYDRSHHEKRIAALTGKVAVIKVGGATETEIEEKKFRVDDAVAAVKAALEEGVVVGGGVSLISLSEEIKTNPDPSIAAGADVLKAALIQPFRILLGNAGLNPDEWLPRLKTTKAKLLGVDVSNPGDPDKDSNNGLVDLKVAGIIDPARVTREAIQNAVSIGGTAITMGALVVDIPEKESAVGPGPDAGMGGF